MWFEDNPDVAATPSLWEQLKTGEAGWAARLGVSLAVLTALVAAAMLMLALVDTLSTPNVYQVTQRDGTIRTYNRSRIDDEHVALAVAVSAAVWCFALTRIWATHRRFRLLLRGLFGVVGIWAIAIPLAVALEAWTNQSEELWIAMTILSGFAGTFLWVTHIGHQAAAGRRLRQQDAAIHISCPRCGYSMVGLQAARCPECGTQFTLDELIRSQDFTLPSATTHVPVREVQVTADFVCPPTASDSGDPV